MKKVLIELLDKYPNVQKVLAWTDQYVSMGKSVTFAIDGNSGAGKSTLGTLLGQVFNANVFRMDDFFLRPEQRTKERAKEVGGNVDYERFKVEILDNLKQGSCFTYRVYDCSMGKLTEQIKVSPTRVNVIEGVYSMHPYLRDAYDFTVFLAIDLQTQIKRIRHRNGEAMLERYLNEWIPLENQYFSQFKIAELADIKIRPDQSYI